MPHHEFFWTAEANWKVEVNNLTLEDVEFAVRNAIMEEVSRSSGRPAYRGPTPDGRMIFVVYEEIDALVILVVTAFEVGEQ